MLDRRRIEQEEGGWTGKAQFWSVGTGVFSVKYRRFMIGCGGDLLFQQGATLRYLKNTRGLFFQWRWDVKRPEREFLGLVEHT